MPIFIYECVVCKKGMEVRAAYNAVPMCCKKFMNRVPTAPSLIQIRNDRGQIKRSEGYKRGYAQDYGKDVPTIFNS